MNVRPTTQEYVKRFISAAAREKICLKETVKTTRWFETPAREGFGGLLEFAPGKLRIRGVFIQPEFRGLGIETELTDALIKYALETLKAQTLEVIALNPSFYEARNFTKTVEIRPGSWRLTYAKPTNATVPS